MSAREWKPGDVGVHARFGYRAIRVSHCLDKKHDGYSAPHWHACAADGYGGWDPDGIVYRPVPTIDPEKREDVERLVALAIGVPQPFSMRIDDMQDALREYADPKPAKPDEPTGLGAVVEDADGKRWVRAGLDYEYALSENWRCTTGDDAGWWQRYDQIDVVRVLSEGVTE
jgi:hypothetical protein